MRRLIPITHVSLLSLCVTEVRLFPRLQCDCETKKCRSYLCMQVVFPMFPCWCLRGKCEFQWKSTDFLWNKDVSLWAPHLDLAFLCVFRGFMSEYMGHQWMSMKFVDSGLKICGFHWNQWIDASKSVDFMGNLWIPRPKSADFIEIHKSCIHEVWDCLQVRSG